MDNKTFTKRVGRSCGRCWMRHVVMAQKLFVR